MGEEIRSSSFKAADFTRYQDALKRETATLEQWFRERRFSDESFMAGFELEAWLVDENLSPAPLNELFLKNLNSHLASPELASFNIEINSTPRKLRDNVFTQMKNELDQTWKECQRTAKDLHADVVMTGILPTLDNDVLNLANMSKMERYRALNREVLHQRKGKPMKFDINGVEHLKVIHRDVMMESAATSFQVHIQVNQDNAVRIYNASVALTGPLLALSVNSPYLFGKDLWNETRIPVFEQAVEVGGYDGAAFGPVKRVTFGDTYLRESLFECFKENLEHYPTLLPVEFESDEKLPHLRLHNGTIWRWNRPLIGFDENGKPHLRIEQRVIPSGPTTIDAIANAAFYYGAVTALAAMKDPVEKQLPHSYARDNFYAAARKGLRSTQRWINGEDLNARDLIIHKLLPLAHQGLISLGVSASDSDEYLDIIYQRVVKGQTGAAWQRLFVEKHGRNMHDLLKAYMNNQNSGEPVHKWNFQKLDEKSTTLNVLDRLPAGILDAEGKDLQSVLGGPTLIRLQGRQEQVLFVSVLLHGNETSGWDAIKEILKNYQDKDLPRGLYIFIGNVYAAAEAQRLLEGQKDFNRVWKAEGDTAEEKMARTLLEILSRTPLFAAIDVHNNTGMNPHYACINHLSKDYLQLAALFGRTVVYFTNPDSVMSMAMSKYCPAVTVECGKAEDKKGAEHARAFIEACLHLAEFPAHEVAAHDVDIFHTVATVKVPEDIDFGVDKKGASLNFIANLDRLNFQELAPGTIIGEVNCENTVCLQAINDEGKDVARQYFKKEENTLRLSAAVMPSMLTLDEKIIRQDCLCYLMERLEYPVNNE